MNATTNPTWVIIDINEFEFLKEWDRLTELDLKDLITNKALFTRFINDAIRNIRYWVLNFQFKTKEEVQTQINTLIQLRNWLEKTWVWYKEYLDSLSKEKEIKESDVRTEAEKKEAKEIIKIKTEFNI